MKTQGYIEKVDPEDVTTSGKVWYLPHFATQHAKFRVVYDGSAEFRGRSINQETLTEPVICDNSLSSRTVGSSAPTRK